MQTIVAGTGHRPPRLGLGYDPTSRKKLIEFARERLEALETRPSMVISGMAQGWDQALAFAALSLDLPLLAAPAFKGMEKKWPTEGQAHYSDILAKAAEVCFVCEPGYHPRKFIERDHWMVDHATHLLALWDGIKVGGTWATVNYAQQLHVPVVNVWSDWKMG